MATTGCCRRPRPELLFLPGRISSCVLPPATMYVSVRVSPRLVFFRSSEATCDVEPQINLVRASASRELAERGRERVREIQLERVPTGPLLNTNPPFPAVGVVAMQTRCVLAGDVAGVRETQPAAQPREPRVVMV